MKTLLITSALFIAPFAYQAEAQSSSRQSDLGSLARLCAEQERQIKQLESENSELRSKLRMNLNKPSKTIASNKKSVTGSVQYTVRSGDTFTSIARKHGINISQLANANKSVKPDRISIGQKLNVPTTAPKAIAVDNPTKTQPQQTIKKAPSIATSGSYKVRKGDTLYGIARKHNTSISKLTAANPNINTSKLKIGQTINLNAGAKIANKPAIPQKPIVKIDKKKPVIKDKAPTLTSNSKPQPVISKENTLPKISEKPKEKIGSHVSQPKAAARPVKITEEMTYAEFAKKHGTTVAQLNAINYLEIAPDELMAVGSDLYVPAK